MTSEQRAQQFWSVLAFAAREQTLISYSMLSQITGCSETPCRILDYIHCYCQQHDLPSLDVIVVDAVTGRPSDECIWDFRDWSAQQSRVFLYDWVNHPAPSDEILKEALEKQEALEMANAGYIALPC